MEAINERLKAIDAAVEERCEAILAAAEEAAAKVKHELKYRLMGMPKKVKSMNHKEYIQTIQQPAEAGEGDAAAAAVDSKIAELQKCSEAAATAAPTTRSLRSRARAATGAAAAAAEPRTVRATRARQPVPKFAEAAAAATEAAGTTAAEPTQEPQDQQPEASTSAAAAAAADVPDSSTPPAAGRGSHGRSTTAALPALPELPADDEQQPAAEAATAVDDPKRASIVSRAQAKVDAKLASMGLAASTAARGAGRTALRAPQPGEAFFSKNGSPLSIHPNVTRSRGRTAASGWALMTPAVAAAAQGAAGPNGSMLGCFTLVKKGGVAAGAAAATGRAGRGRARTAAAPAPADHGKAEAGGDTAMVIMTHDGMTFTVDAAAGGLESVPTTHRQEVEAKLRAIQQLAANALKGL